MNETLKNMLEMVVKQATDWAKNQGVAIGKQLAKDTAAFMAESTANIARWSALALDGQLTPEEVADLIKGQGELAAMKALTETGLSLVEIEKLRKQMLDTVGTLVGGAIGALK